MQQDVKIVKTRGSKMQCEICKCKCNRTITLKACDRCVREILGKVKIDTDGTWVQDED